MFSSKVVTVLCIAQEISTSVLTPYAVVTGPTTVPGVISGGASSACDIHFSMLSCPSLRHVLTISSYPFVFIAGGIAGIVLGLVGSLVLLALVLVSLWIGIPHLKRSGGESHSRRQSSKCTVRWQ